MGSLAQENDDFFPEFLADKTTLVLHCGGGEKTRLELELLLLCTSNEAIYIPSQQQYTTVPMHLVWWLP